MSIHDMKVGDRIYCFKDYYINSSSGWKLFFRKGEWYRISDIKYIDDYREHYGSCYRENEENIPTHWIDIRNYSRDLRSFSLIRNGDKNFFYDHFYTELELRKFKLEKIKCTHI